MLINGSSEKADEFYEQNKDLPEMLDSGVSIRVLELPSGYLRVMIDIGEFSTAMQIREAIPFAKEWQRRLIDFQGKTGHLSKYALLRDVDEDLNSPRSSKYIDSLNKKFKLSKTASYTKPAVLTCINQKIASWIIEASGHNISPKYEETNYTKAFNSRTEWITQGISDPIKRCKVVLSAFKFKDEEIQFIIDEGLKSANNGEYPFLAPDYPLDLQKFISILRWWHNEK